MLCKMTLKLAECSCCLLTCLGHQSSSAVTACEERCSTGSAVLPLKIKINIYVGQEGTWDVNTAKPSVLCRSCSAMGSLASLPREAGEAECLLVRSSC